MPFSTKTSPLLTFMRALTAEQKEDFATAVGTTPRYLIQLATQDKPNPLLRTALLICSESARIAKVVNSTYARRNSAERKLAPLTLLDILNESAPCYEQFTTERGLPNTAA